MKYSAEKLASLVVVHSSVFNEIMARDTVFRMDLDDDIRRRPMPWAHWGREFMQQEEFDIWVVLDERNVAEYEAVEQITDLMEKYYGMPYPLRRPKEARDQV